MEYLKTTIAPLRCGNNGNPIPTAPREPCGEMEPVGLAGNPPAYLGVK